MAARILRRPHAPQTTDHTLSNAYDKFDRRLRGQDANASSASPTSDNKPNSAQSPEGRGYITPRGGYVPSHSPQPSNKSQPQFDYQPSRPPVSPVSPADDRDHPLHRHYRKRIRGIRARWFSSGVVLGGIAGILLTLIVSALVVTQFPSVLQTFTGEPDLAVVIGEGYLNRESVARIQNGAPMTVGPLKLTGLTIDLKPDNRMDLHPQFTADVILTTLNFGASVQNQLSVQDGKLVISMVGDPQLGDLNVPLEMLPFNLKDSTRQAVDKIDNDLLAAEINRTLENASSGTNAVIDGVTTTETSLTIRMQQK